MAIFKTPVLGGPKDGDLWVSEQAPQQDDQLTYERDFDGLQALYFFQWDYQGRGPRFVYWRSQMPQKYRKAKR